MRYSEKMRLSVCFMAIVLALMGVGAKSAVAQFSNETAWDDGTNFHYQVSYTGSYAHFEVFLDTDNNASTGYTINNIGADYLLEDTAAYKSTANGSSWSWSSSIGTVTETAGTGTIELSVPLTVIGSPGSAKVAFQALSSSWAPTVDPTVVTYTKSTGTTFSNEKAWDDGTNFYYSADYTGSFPNFNVFLDTNGSTSGYPFNGIDANYLLEDTEAYSYSGSGGSWSWTSLSAVTETIGSGTIEMETPLTVIGSPSTATVGLQVETSGWVGTTDPHIVTYTRSGGGTAATPTFSPAGGAYSGSQSVTISDTTSGATIYYTTNGTTPTTSSTKYTSAIPIASSETIEAIATASGYTNSAVGSAGYTISTPTAATPTFSPAAGSYSSAQSVTISDSTSGATIYYTTNGTTPTTSSTKYTAAISVTSSETIEAIAAASGYNNSAVGSAAYTIGTSTAATPTFSPAAGTYSSAQLVTISDTTSGATIYYTTNGTTPTTSSTKYTSAISVTSSETIEAIAVASGYNNSAVGSAAYTITLPTVATPTFSPAAGTYSSAQSVTISDTTSGATIYYTTNGTTPTTSSTKYTAAISVTSSETIETIASASGYNNSSVGSAAYTISSGAASYYVSTTGSDSNAGTLSAPWLTPQHAANVVGAGSTVYLEAGTYAPFQVNVSGSASGGYITFTNYSGQTAIIDGTGFTGEYDEGLIHILDQSYIIVEGLTVRNGSSSNTSFSPVGICVKDTGNYDEVLNNTIYNISNTASGGNAHGILVRGENASTTMTNITVSGNTIYDCTLGDSESLTMAGNLNTFTVSNNIVHDNNNIGIDCEGGYSSIAGGAQATNGTVTGNTVYNCSTIDNPNYDVYSCAGLYDDGAVNVVFNGNIVYSCDIGVSTASENSGYYSSGVTVRNNLIYQNQTYGIRIGGYDSSVGGTENCSFINNTIYDDDLQDWWCGEIGVGWKCTGCEFYNNVIYAGASNDVFVKDVGTDGSSVGTFNYNDFYSADGESNAKWQWINQTSYVYGLSAWQSESGQDENSIWGNPLFDSLSSPFNFNLGSGSPALNSGDYGLGSSLYGSTDFAGNARTKSGTIDMGAYED